MKHSDTDREAFYAKWFPRLEAIAVEEFRIPIPDASRLAFDVLVCSMTLNYHGNLEAWLEAALRAEARSYLQNPDRARLAPYTY